MFFRESAGKRLGRMSAAVLFCVVLSLAVVFGAPFALAQPGPGDAAAQTDQTQPAPEKDVAPAQENASKPPPAQEFARAQPAPSPDVSAAQDAAPTEAVPEDSSNPDYDTLTQLLATRTADLTALMEEASSLKNSAESLTGPLSDKVSEARAQMARLAGLFQISRGHPTEQIALLRQMNTLRDSLNRSIKPLEDIAATITINLEEVAGLETDMENLRKESKTEGGISIQAAALKDRVELKNYVTTMADAKDKLTRAEKRLKQILGPARLTVKRISEIIAKSEGGLADIWKNYYLIPAGNDLSSLALFPALLKEWASSLDTRLSFAYPQNPAQWWEAVKNFVVSALIIGLLGLFALRGTRSLPDYWRQAGLDVIKKALLWTGVGMAVLNAAMNRSGGIYFVFVLLGSLLIIYGVAALSWRLRVAARPMLKDKPSPLSRLFPPAVLGVVMLFSDLSPRILCFLWGLAMIAFLVRIVAIHRRHARLAGERPPLLERIFYSCAFWFGLASLAVDAAGYARLAILLYMFLFALVNTVTLGNGLMYMFSGMVGHWLDKEKFPVRHAMAEAVAIPLSWVLSLLCTLPWIWAVPGANQILRQGLSTSYTVGEASFDFSKLLLIIVLFFLFRSFISLSKTTLKHLPERLPHLERGVIPPLQTMASYAFWVLFALVVMGLLGVNFTSLAVVAGGLSVGIGFGMQTLFNNLISGLMLIFGRNILIGDYVEVGGIAGTVRAINIRSTTIETPERALVYVPNSSFMANQFSNWTRNSRMVRRSIMVGVAYGSDPELVTSLLLQAAEEQEHVLKFPAPMVLFNNFGASSLDFTLHIFIDDLDNGLVALSGVRANIQKLFSAHNIDIPFPQMTLHVPSESGADKGAKPEPLLSGKTMKQV